MITLAAAWGIFWFVLSGLFLLIGSWADHTHKGEGNALIGISYIGLITSFAWLVAVAFAAVLS